MISVIVPVFNEERVLTARREYFGDLARQAEVIFVDGGSTDRSVAVLDGALRVIRAPKGRARQMNAGAAAAEQDILLFHHADNTIETGTLRMIEEQVAAEGLAGGCLRQVIDQPGWLFRWIAWTGNVRARCRRIYYGDQGMFVRKDVFQKLGGFPECEIGEDVAFSKMLRRHGPVRMLPCPVTCSARRWLSQGVVKTTLINTRIKLGLMLGDEGQQLTEVYRDIR